MRETRRVGSTSGDRFNTRQRKSHTVIKIFLVCAALVALLTLAIPGAPGVQVVAVAALCVVAVMAALQSLSDGRYVRFSGFVAMVMLMNPIGPVSLTRIPTLALLGVCFAILCWITMVRGAMPSRSIAQVLYGREAQ
jgi:hypothetical protein